MDRNQQFEAIANGLADNGYAVVDHFLSEDEVDKIFSLEEFVNAMLQFRRAGVGKNQGHQINENVRGDYIQWIDHTRTVPELKLYFDRLFSLMTHLNQNLFLSLKDVEVHMTVYPVGSFYKRHLDQFKADDHRKLSVICYLNEQWKEEHGGQLRMHLREGSKDIFPQAGRLVCFRSDQVEHEVLPTQRERLSLTGWILDRHSLQ